MAERTVINDGKSSPPAGTDQQQTGTKVEQHDTWVDKVVQGCHNYWQAQRELGPNPDRTPLPEEILMPPAPYLGQNSLPKDSVPILPRDTNSRPKTSVPYENFVVANNENDSDAFKNRLPSIKDDNPKPSTKPESGQQGKPNGQLDLLDFVKPNAKEKPKPESGQPGTPNGPVELLDVYPNAYKENQKLEAEKLKLEPMAVTAGVEALKAGNLKDLCDQAKKLAERGDGKVDAFQKKLSEIAGVSVAFKDNGKNGVELSYSDNDPTTGEKSSTTVTVKCDADGKCVGARETKADRPEDKELDANGAKRATETVMNKIHERTKIKKSDKDGAKNESGESGKPDKPYGLMEFQDPNAPKEKQKPEPKLEPMEVTAGVKALKAGNLKDLCDQAKKLAERGEGNVEAFQKKLSELSGVTVVFNGHGKEGVELSYSTKDATTRDQDFSTVTVKFGADGKCVGAKETKNEGFTGLSTTTELDEKGAKKATETVMNKIHEGTKIKNSDKDAHPGQESGHPGAPKTPADPIE